MKAKLHGSGLVSKNLKLPAPRKDTYVAILL